jgi:hypothetical protein
MHMCRSEYLLHLHQHHPQRDNNYLCLHKRVFPGTITTIYAFTNGYFAGITTIYAFTMSLFPYFLLDNNYLCLHYVVIPGTTPSATRTTGSTVPMYLSNLHIMQPHPDPLGTDNSCY